MCGHFGCSSGLETGRPAPKKCPQPTRTQVVSRVGRFVSDLRFALVVLGGVRDTSLFGNFRRESQAIRARPGVDIHLPTGGRPGERPTVWEPDGSFHLDVIKGGKREIEV